MNRVFGGHPCADFVALSARLTELLVGRRGARLAPGPPLVAVALDLPGEVLRAEVDRVREVARGLAAAERHPLQVQRRLRNLRLRDRGISLLEDLDLEPCEFG